MPTLEPDDGSPRLPEPVDPAHLAYFRIIQRIALAEARRLEWIVRNPDDLAHDVAIAFAQRWDGKPVSERDGSVIAAVVNAVRKEGTRRGGRTSAKEGRNYLSLVDGGRLTLGSRAAPQQVAPSRADGSVRSKEGLALFNQLMLLLSEQDRRGMVLVRIDEWSYERTALFLGMSERALKRRLVKATKKLRPFIGPYLVDGSLPPQIAVAVKKESR